uniref:C2H2-type domain-containing protein n=1 Tax=Cacopsylla melanoneura TaxID=428564 RepID=A0A8D8TAS1_9HEMI
MKSSCHICKKYSTTDVSHIRRHQLNCMKKKEQSEKKKNIQEEKIKMCCSCSFTTINKKQLIKHMKVNHNKKVYKCDFCTSYKSSDSYNHHRHVSLCHKCKYCNFIGDLNSHMKNTNHTSKKCEKCEKKFPSTYYFNQHLNICKQPPSNQCEVITAINKNFKILRFTNFKECEDLKKNNVY